MTLDALASDIDNAAEGEAKAITDAAKAQCCFLHSSESSDRLHEDLPWILALKPF